MRTPLTPFAASLTALAAVAGLTAHAAFADPTALYVANPSFEEPHLSRGMMQAGAPDGWQYQGSGTAATQDFRDLDAFSGGENYAPDSQQVGSISRGGSLFQDLPGIRIRQGAVYHLTVSIGRRKGDFGDGGLVSLETTDGDMLATSQIVTPASGTFADVTVSYTGADSMARKSLRIRLTDPGTRQANFDNVRLTVEENSSPDVDLAPRPAPGTTTDPAAGTPTDRTGALVVHGSHIPATHNAQVAMMKAIQELKIGLRASGAAPPDSVASSPAGARTRVVAHASRRVYSSHRHSRGRRYYARAHGRTAGATVAAAKSGKKPGAAPAKPTATVQTVATTHP